MKLFGRVVVWLGLLVVSWSCSGGWADGDVPTDGWPGEGSPSFEILADRLERDSDVNGTHAPGDVDFEATADGTDAAGQPWPWPTCAAFADQGPTLGAKAGFLDELVVKQHLPDGLLRTVSVDENGDVVKLYNLPSTGLWTAVYLASQALRFAVTGEQAAVENARSAVKGLHHLTAVTGMPGLYGRCYARPDFVYNSDVAGAPTWAESTVPGYEGWWFNFDVSKDTMDGIMFGYAVALELLEDEEILGIIREDVADFVTALVENGLQIIDISGEVTEHGRLFYSAMDDFPGFNAILASSWIRVALTESGDPDLEHFYYDCLMRKSDGADCPAIDAVDLGSYMDAIENLLSLYMADCQTSYDNIDMVFHAAYPLMRRETDPDLAARLEKVLEVGIWERPEPHLDPPVHQSTHSLYIFMYGALAQPSPDDEVFMVALDDALCTLRRLPQDRSSVDVAAGLQEEACINRLGRPNAAEIIPVEERSFDNYIWRLDPYEIPEAQKGVPGMVHSPDDYLLAYWMGRYYGYISEDM